MLSDPNPTRRQPATRLRPSYQEADPDPALRPWIRCYYLVQLPAGRNRSVEGLLVPDGHLEMAFNLGGARFDLIDGVWSERPRHCLDEVFARARRIRWQNGIRYVGIKFRYEAALELIALDPCELRAAPVETSLLSLRRLSDVPERLESAGGWRTMKGILDDFFLGRLDSIAPDPLVAEAGSAIRSSAGALSLTRLSEDFGVSPRTLQLRVKSRTGLTPKRLAQIVRVREAIRRLTHEPPASLSRLAAGLGYCDQSHFIREFRGVVGTPPTEFLRELQFVSELCSRPESTGSDPTPAR